MKKSNVNLTIKRLDKMVKSGEVSFEYPVQRAGEQWDNMQKSLLIHSIADGFPIPPIYSTVQDGIFYILDGKQRLSNIIDFVNNKYQLNTETPDCTIEDEIFILAESTFEEIEEEIQDEILGCTLQVYKIDEASDEEIEEMFFRLNNGTPLSKQQKSKAKMGKAWAMRLTELTNHSLVKNKASFTKLQLRKADDETAILQTMMLLDKDYELKSISSNDVFKYALGLKDNDDKKQILDTIKDAMDYLDNALEEQEKLLLRKVHFPMMLLTTVKAMKLNIPAPMFADWVNEFKLSMNDKGTIKTYYKMYGGQGSVKKEKVFGRINEMITHLETYVDMVNKDNNKVVEFKQSNEDNVEIEDTEEKDNSITEDSEDVEQVEEIEEEIIDTAEVALDIELEK